MIAPAPDFHAPGEPGVVGKNDTVAQLAVVGDVGVSHQKALRANARWLLRVGRAMDGEALADNVVIADLDPSLLAGKGEDPVGCRRLPREHGCGCGRRCAHGCG